jgi:hypothetical protein
MYMLLMVLDDSARLREVLEAWEGAGVKGITIFESTGLHRMIPRHSPQPMYAGFSHIFGGGSAGHHTLFAIVDSMELAEAVVEGTEEILGDLSEPHTGIISAMPVSKVWGMPEPYELEP